MSKLLISEERKRQILKQAEYLDNIVGDGIVDIVKLATQLGFHVYNLKDRIKYYGLIAVDTSDKKLLKDADTSKIIGFNPSLNSTRNRRAIAVELGHYFLHFDKYRKKDRFQYIYKENRKLKKTEEYEAEIFADNLLVPKRKLKAFLKQYPTGMESSMLAIDEAARHFDVSINCIERILNQ